MKGTVYLFPKVNIIERQKLGDLKQPFFFFSWAEMNSLMVLETRSPKSRCCQCSATSLMSLGVDPSWPLPASGTPGLSWFVAASR